MDNLWIVIAVGPREKYLSSLLNKLNSFKGRIVFVNNNKPYKKFDGVHHIEDFEEVNIHRWWNKGINYAKDMGATHVAIINDDLDFSKDFISEMYDFVIKNNYLVCDVGNSGNGGGAAFIIDLSSGFMMEESLRWWYGDTLLFDRAKKVKRFGRFNHPSFKHFEPNKQMIESGFLSELTHNDKKQYSKLRKLI
jgi:hypothetical protein